MPRILLQAVLFLLASLPLGFLANLLHPNGLDPWRDYFPAAADPSEISLVEGITFLDLASARDYWASSWDAGAGVWNEDNQIYFLDARRRASFKDGHIPGAWLADRYASEDYLDVSLIDRLRNAFAIVVYCTGGECEDSIHTATDLKYRWQVPAECILIFEGGIDEWREAGLPIANG